MSDYSIRRLLVDEPRPEFDCSDDDLNEFFKIDSIVSGQELLAVTYVIEVDGEVVAFFSLSNDAIKKELLDKVTYKKITTNVPLRKRYSTLPAVKIGRLATAVTRQSLGIGSEILDFIKYWFTEGNKTGCRFIIVDAYNKPKTTKFYLKNEFSYLLTSDETQKITSDETQKTRLMFFDLRTVQP